MAATTIADLPDDIICNILLEGVSSSQSYALPSLRRPPPDPAPFGILIPTKPHHFSILELDNDDLARLGCQNATVKFKSKIYIPRKGYKGRVIGACNGLVCLRVDKNIVVCNPILQGRRPFVLPKLPKLPKWAYSRSRLGFGFSPLSDEYKVLRCNHETISYREGHIISFEVRTLGRDDTWRSIGGGGGHNRIPFPRRSTSPGIDFVFVNGELYWLGRDTASRLVLCYFDVENEELGSTPSLPCEIDGIVHLGDKGFLCHRDSGFGFCPETNQYKVLRLLYPSLGFGFGSLKLIQYEAEINTVGTNLWRRVGDAPYNLQLYWGGCFLHGALHRIVHDPENCFESMCGFDFGKEQFQPFPGPSQFHGLPGQMKLGVLKDGMSLYHRPSDYMLDIWAMKYYRCRTLGLKILPLNSHGYLTRAFILNR
ncbi:hypothetical protein RHGRI_009865 [Rhododendron griersonianum]|uniref:F-box protein n=1 Tax=Rhododendron griersonianum TaxID=479676 RepID=A0AAV6KH12_9ERIC|nr:hypothetical protein RHGRI_009865 [Rhododendron griersonianum]